MMTAVFMAGVFAGASLGFLIAVLMEAGAEIEEQR